MQKNCTLQDGGPGFNSHVFNKSLKLIKKAPYITYICPVAAHVVNLVPQELQENEVKCERLPGRLMTEIQIPLPLTSLKLPSARATPSSPLAGE